MKKNLTVYTSDGSIVAVFYSVRREDDKLVVDGKALDVMRMDMIFTLEEVFNGLRMALSWEVILYVLLFPYFGLRYVLRKLWKGK